jgi:hypothetical protein
MAFAQTIRCMRNNPVHPLLAHLGEDQIDELITRFYSRESITKILCDYRIDCLPSVLHKLLPPEISADSCPNCGEAMLLPRLSRSKFLSNYENVFQCSCCYHKESKRCSCNYCRPPKQETCCNSQPSVSEERSRQHIQLVCLIQADDLSLEQAVSLLALVKCCGLSGLKKEIRLDKLDVPFAPISIYGDKLLSRLIDAALVRIIEKTYPSTVPSFAGNMVVTYSPSIQWGLSDSTLKDLIIDIESRADSEQWPGHWYAEISALVFDLAFAECMEFFDWCARERNFPAIDETSKSGLIRDLLKDFSVGYSCRAINSAAQYAADHWVTKACTLQQAANYMLVSCQRWSDKARIEHWQVKPFRRNINCPRSMMSNVLYDIFLKIPDDEGFNMPIAEIYPQHYGYS